jgi:hypothetical protein
MREVVEFSCVEAYPPRADISAAAAGGFRGCDNCGYCVALTVIR